MKKASIIKRLMIGALTASLVMAPAMSVIASSGGNGGETPGDKVEEIVQSSTNNEITSIAEVPATSAVAGVKSTVAGTYMATSVSGCAVATGVAAISEAYGLTGSEKAYAKFSNMEAKKSPLAMAAINTAAAANGAVVGPCVNLELGKMNAGKYSLLSSDGATIQISLGIPKSFLEDGKTYAMVSVRPGGVVSILPNISTKAGVISFETTGGAGTYAMIKY